MQRWVGSECFMGTKFQLGRWSILEMLVVAAASNVSVPLRINDGGKIRNAAPLPWPWHANAVLFRGRGRCLFPCFFLAKPRVLVPYCCCDRVPHT